MVGMVAGCARDYGRAAGFRTGDVGCRHSRFSNRTRDGKS